MLALVGFTSLDPGVLGMFERAATDCTSACRWLRMPIAI